MQSDFKNIFKNIFIGTKNSKCAKSNLIDNKKDPINSHSLSSITGDRLIRNVKISVKVFLF
ncbi:hypothetical protein KVE05_03190 [Helicobacter pylori]|nr:hypothetical protein KVE05_03190 [Helicobacter pylori]